MFILVSTSGSKKLLDDGKKAWQPTILGLTLKPLYGSGLGYKYLDIMSFVSNQLRIFMFPEFSI